MCPVSVRDRPDSLIAAGLPRCWKKLEFESIGFPGNEKFKTGAIACGGTIFREDDVIGNSRILQQIVDDVIAKEQHEHDRLERPFGDVRQSVHLAGRQKKVHPIAKFLFFCH